MIIKFHPQKSKLILDCMLNCMLNMNESLNKHSKVAVIPSSEL